MKTLFSVLAILLLCSCGDHPAGRRKGDAGLSDTVRAQCPEDTLRLADSAVNRTGQQRDSNPAL